MGWSRTESLVALEKFDYNIDKVSPQSFIFCPTEIATFLLTYAGRGLFDVQIIERYT